ncbi:MFS transporter [uncultured Desulfosarcina sp.]|uniref:MFS transporter n=1 Tax=uncultured Desulfosarcina sp. TaxID=218289 RepID=UPI0029C66753|nr:MFS transporter [uncultured Desulfosarcina sp.]
MIKYRRWIIYFISCLLFVFSQFYRSSIAVITPNLVNELHFDPEELGLISAAFFYSFAAMQIPVALYLDRVGPRLLMTALSLLAAAGAIVFAYGNSSEVLIVGRILLGIGMSCNLMGPLKLVTTWFSPVYFATLSAIFVSVGTAGNIMAATPLVWFTNQFGWRTTFILFALCNLLITILFFSVAKDSPEGKPAKHPKEKSARLSGFTNDIMQLFYRKDYWLISMGTFFRYGIYASVQALWAAPFLMTVLGFSQLMTGNLLFAMSIGMIIGSPICGWISDRVLLSRKNVVIAGLAVMAGILIVLSLLSKGVWTFIIFALFFGFGFSSGSGQIMYAHIKERMPLKNAGSAMTGINFFTMIGGAFFLHGIGWAIKAFHAGGAFGPEVLKLVFVFFGISLFVTALFYMFTVDGKQNY